MKSSGLKDAEYAKGGCCLHVSNSQFLKVPDSFRTDKQKTDYASTSKPKGKDKSLPAIKPRC
jgi:hypothetical protein